MRESNLFPVELWNFHVSCFEEKGTSTIITGSAISKNPVGIMQSSSTISVLPFSKL